MKLFLGEGTNSNHIYQFLQSSQEELEKNLANVFKLQCGDHFYPNHLLPKIIDASFCALMKVIFNKIGPLF